MKLLRTVVALALVLPLFGAAQDADKALRIEDVAWIAGSWVGESDGGLIEEHWMASSGGTMSGMSRLVIRDRTVFHEYLRIVTNAEGAVSYMAQPGGRCPATAFRLTKASASEAVFENPEHDFPQSIRYQLHDNGETLVAIVEGEENGQKKAHESRFTRGTLVAR